MALHQFDYIFAIAMLFAFLDAFNIGATTWRTHSRRRSLLDL